MTHHICDTVKLVTVELRSSIENLVQKYKHDAHASSLFGDQDKARVYNCFANQLKNLLKGGA
ncbi:TPA: hypothetical protein R7O75_002876 [Acinetobacter baumannii]|nr:hypothetical protein [Acinetobacter baumannii]